jgi:hypothetical protein
VVATEGGAGAQRACIEAFVLGHGDKETGEQTNDKLQAVDKRRQSRDMISPCQNVPVPFASMDGTLVVL